MSTLDLINISVTSPPFTSHVIFLPAPSPVTGLKLSASSRNLDVSWQPGLGRAEHFWLRLTEQGSLTQNVTLDSRVSTYTFTSVTAGTLCRVAIVAESEGKQSDLVSEEILTGKIATSKLI